MEKKQTGSGLPSFRVGVTGFSGLFLSLRLVFLGFIYDRFCNKSLEILAKQSQCICPYRL